MTEEFVWPEFPPESWWREAGADCRASEIQIKFAALFFQGVNASEALRRAGGAPETASALKQRAHSLSRSVAVTNLIGLARAEAAGSSREGTVSVEEARQILSRMARQAGENARVRSIELLMKLDEQAEARAEPDRDPQEILAELAGISPLIAKELQVSTEAEVGGEGACAQIAREWIEQHPDETMRLLGGDER
jgi:hypothetical protein